MNFVDNIIDTAYQRLSKHCNRVTRIDVNIDRFNNRHSITIEGRELRTDQRYGVCINLLNENLESINNIDNFKDYLHFKLTNKLKQGRNLVMVLNISSIYAKHY